MKSDKDYIKESHSSHPRVFQTFTYCYPVLSRRAGGISIGINLNLDKNCNFDCPYCQVNRTVKIPKQNIDLNIIRAELESLLSSFDANGICTLAQFASIPNEGKKLTDLAISGDGEPTMFPEFSQTCAFLSDIQKQFSYLDFSLNLITNSTLLDRENVLDGIGHLLAQKGEVWAKLDAGTEGWYQKINISKISLDKIQSNLIRLGEKYPFKIQTLFCAIDGLCPSEKEVSAYLDRLKKILSSGSNILEVQLHTLARKPSQSFCTPVIPDFLEKICSRIKNEVGIFSKVYGIEK